MKIRTDFVTNSSSSSFTIQLDIKLKNNDNISFWGKGATSETGPTGSFSDEINVTLDVAQAGQSKEIDELIYYIKNGIYEGKHPKFNDNSSFIKQIRKKVTSMSDIKQITMEVKEENYFLAKAKYSYNLSTGKMTFDRTKDYFPGENEIDGESGGSLNVKTIKYAQEPTSDSYVFDLPDVVYLRETSFEGRNERIEKLRIGDELQFKLSPDLENDPNRIEVYNNDGSLGFLNSEASDVISKCMYARNIRIVVSEVTPVSQRNVHAKSSKVILDVTSSVKDEYKAEQGEIEGGKY